MIELQRKINRAALPALLAMLLMGCDVPNEFQRETIVEVEADSDNDGIADVRDNCLEVANPGQENKDDDDLGDACDPCPSDPTDTCNNAPPPSPAADSDRDGTSDTEDNCPARFNADQRDTDLDGVGDACDNCIETSNRNQEDNNKDGIGDACPPTFVVFILLTCEAADDPAAPEIRVDCTTRTTGDDGSQPRAVETYLFELERRGDPVGVSERTQEGNVSLFPPKEIACDGDDGDVFGVRLTANLNSGVDHIYQSNSGDSFIVETETGLKIPDDLCP